MARREGMLSDRDNRFLDNVRMGMDLRPAMLAAGWTADSARLRTVEGRPLLAKALADVYAENRRKAEISRDEVLEGFREAINDAKLAGEPATQIKGWTEIGKMCGFYAPEKKEVRLTASAAGLEEQLQGLTTEQLLELAGQDTLEVLEGECTRVD